MVRTTAEALERFRAEVKFAEELMVANPRSAEAWRELVTRALATVQSATEAGAGVLGAVAEAESILAPIGLVAKEYTIHCVGHAHIDMNWMWDWPETVATTNDTFSTVVKLMEEFPEFRFSQSQGSVYQILKDYLPELYAKVKELIAQGRWEVTASQWVEGDKNMASGEILARHLLYTKRFAKQELGLPYDAVTIDWEPDTFGHPRTLPTLLNSGGVKRYYLHRGAHGPKLFWWQGKDGSRVLTFDDCDRGYNGTVDSNIVRGLMAFELATSLKDYLFVYGVGDHGGGPTRRDIKSALQLNTWPIFPNIVLSTTDAFFSIAESQGQNLPVVDAELNTVEEGCYTSQSRVKFINRKGENALVEAEMAALLGGSLAGMAYPTEGLNLAWRHTMFIQFHDILPGSGVRGTYEHAGGLFQEVMSQTNMVKTRALRMVAGKVNTAGICDCAPTALPDSAWDRSLGAGQGDSSASGAVSRWSPGSASCDAFVIFNPSPWARTEVVTTRVWDKEYSGSAMMVRDDQGKTVAAQVVERGGFWGHSYVGVAFPAEKLPGLGYRSYAVLPATVTPAASTGCWGDGKGTIENEFLKVVVEQASGAIVSLVDKRSGADLVPKGGRIGLLEYALECPHGMSAWMMGQVVKRIPLAAGATIECNQNGPHLASVVARHKLNDSNFTVTTSLAAGVPRVDFVLNVEWLERGGPSIGVPSLLVSFPLEVADGVATFECPNGHVERSTDPSVSISHTTKPGNCYNEGRIGLDLNTQEVPSQKWVDLTGEHRATGAQVGATLVNDSKYGFSVIDNTMTMTLLRSSYDPDPHTEQGNHSIRFGLAPHAGAWTSADATREGYAFNFPVNVVGTGIQAGSLPGSKAFAEILTPNVMLSGMKKAEDSDALIVRLYEMDGRATTAQLRLDGALVAPEAVAVETDTMEVPLSASSARMVDGVLNVDIPAFGMATVAIG